MNDGSTKRNAGRRFSRATSRAQSEVVGVAFLTAAIVLLVGVVAVVVLSGAPGKQGPTTNVRVTVESGQVTLQHDGGAALPVDEVSVVIEDGSTGRVPLSSFTEGQGNGDGTFDPGEVRRHAHGSGGVLGIVVVHEPSGTVLLDREYDVPTPTPSSNPNRSPSASFSTSPSPPIEGESTTLDASGSSDPDGSISAYAWDLDNDGTYEGSGRTVTHTFSGPGNRQVTIQITDDQGASASRTRTLTVDAAPEPAFTTAPSPAVTGEAVTVDASGSSDPDGSITDYAWDFDGDGSYEGNGQTATHTYGASGDRSVTLRVTDDSGARRTTTRTVTVTDRPTASFTASPDQPDVNEPTTFDASGSGDSDGSISRYQWDFDGDGSYEGSGQTITHNFTSGGNHTVTLRVTDDAGATNTTSQRVFVDAQPVPRFTVTDNGDGTMTLDASASSDPDGGVDHQLSLAVLEFTDLRIGRDSDDGRYRAGPLDGDPDSSGRRGRERHEPKAGPGIAGRRSSGLRRAGGPRRGAARRTRPSAGARLVVRKLPDADETRLVVRKLPDADETRLVVRRGQSERAPRSAGVVGE